MKQQSEQLSTFTQQLLVGIVQQQKQRQQQPAQQQDEDVPASTIALLAGLCHKHRTSVASIIMSTAPFGLPGAHAVVGHRATNGACHQR